jgi:hypothetical protein
VEAHILEVARWERQEIARQIGVVRQEAEWRYQSAARHGYHLEKEGRSWERAPAQESLFDEHPQSPTASLNNRACVPEEAFANFSQISVPENQTPVRAEKPREPADAPSGTGMDSVGGANCIPSEDRREINLRPLLRVIRCTPITARPPTRLLRNRCQPTRKGRTPGTSGRPSPAQAKVCRPMDKSARRLRIYRNKRLLKVSPDSSAISCPASGMPVR